MKIVFLGTAGWYDTTSSLTSCVLLDTENEYVILDAGNGFCRLPHYLVESKPVYLYLSHYHLDHVAGLHTLPMMVFSEGIEVFGPAGLLEMRDNLLRAPYTRDYRKLPFGIDFTEINGPASLPFPIQSLPLEHSVPCQGYRFFLEDKTISYCPDTSPCKNLHTLSRDADILITECSCPPGGMPVLFHMTPSEAAEIARSSGVKKLYLTHFSSPDYPDHSVRLKALEEARKIFDDTEIALDGLEVTV